MVASVTNGVLTLDAAGSLAFGTVGVGSTATRTLTLRMDDRKQRVIVAADGGEGIGFLGFETANAAALDALAARLEANGTAIVRGTRALADERTAGRQRSVPARPLDLWLSHRTAGYGPCGAHRRALG